MKICDVRKLLLALFLVGMGVGIFLSRLLGLGMFSAVIVIGLGVWRMF